MVNLIGTEDLVYKTDSIEGSFREVFGKLGVKIRLLSYGWNNVCIESLINSIINPSIL